MVVTNSNVTSSSTYESFESRRVLQVQRYTDWPADAQTQAAGQVAAQSKRSSQRTGNGHKADNDFRQTEQELYDALKASLKSSETNTRTGRVRTVEEIKSDLITMLIALIKRNRSRQQFRGSLFDFERLGSSGSENGHYNYFDNANSGKSYHNYGVTLEVVQITEIYERQQMQFSMNGSVTTDDGRTIDFDVELMMSSELARVTGMDALPIGAGVNFCDPLVVGLYGSIPDLADKTWEFDLDCDGELDEIAMLGRGSGFLALDRNGDGVINDGGELFGVSTGNGFSELAEFDKDGNGWIDEADEVFDKLRVWARGDDGHDSLLTLEEAGIGAIYLGAQATTFMHNDMMGNEQGAVRYSSVYLGDDGSVGLIQHIDFAV